MDKTQPYPEARVNIIPANVEWLSIRNFEPGVVGRAPSTASLLKVNKVDDGYTIIMTDEDFMKVNVDVLANNFVNMILKNVKDERIMFSIHYFFENMSPGAMYFNPDVAMKILKFDKSFQAIHNPRVYYWTSNSIRDIVHMFQFIHTTGKKKAHRPNGTIRDVLEAPFDGKKPDTVLRQISDFVPEVDMVPDPDDEDDDEPKKKKKKKKKPDIRSSRILKGCDKPKRDIQRHGVLVYDGKKPAIKDQEEIMTFLKNFFPGNESWKKDFRRQVAKRWMEMYAISEKELKKLNKLHADMMKHPKKYRYAPPSPPKKRDINQEMAMELTRRVLSVPGYNQWNNPNV